MSCWLTQAWRNIYAMKSTWGQPSGDMPGGLPGGSCRGPEGFSRQFWSVDPGSDSSSVTFRYQAADGEQGFPGKLDVSARYSLHGAYGLLIDYRASSDAATVVNLSNHAYFNLNGYPGEIRNHSILINANRYARLDATDIPDGELLDVTGSRFDFTRLVPLAERIVEGGFGPENGYDHTFALNATDGTLAFAAAAFSPDSGLWLKVHTTQPALQFYTGEYLGPPVLRRGGLCFEVQNFPDAPNKANFPSAVLLPGQEYRQSILYEFGTGEL
jgi:aldose 1-epimerase